jgi:hypothetical protein
VVLGPDIRDLAGNPLAAAYLASFTIDKTGPAVVSLHPSGTLSQPVSFVEVLFDSAIDASTFTAADVTLTGPGGVIPTGGPVAVGTNLYRVSFATQRAAGTYTVSIGPWVYDAAGNAMDQNGNGVPGEPGEDVFTASFTIELPDLWLDPADPGSLVAPDTAVFGDPIEVAWTTGNAGNATATGTWTDRLYLSATPTWSANAIALGAQTFDGPLEPGPAMRVRCRSRCLCAVRCLRARTICWSGRTMGITWKRRTRRTMCTGGRSS